MVILSNDNDTEKKIINYGMYQMRCTEYLTENSYMEEEKKISFENERKKEREIGREKRKENNKSKWPKPSRDEYRI